MLVDWVPYSPSDYEWFVVTKRDKRVSKIHAHEQHSIEDPRVTCRPRVCILSPLQSLRIRNYPQSTSPLRICLTVSRHSSPAVTFLTHQLDFNTHLKASAPYLPTISRGSGQFFFLLLILVPSLSMKTIIITIRSSYHVFPIAQQNTMKFIHIHNPLNYDL